MYMIFLRCISVEINPCVISSKGTVHNLDMVVLIDNTEHYRQSQRRWWLSFPPSFWKLYSEEEMHIAPFIERLEQVSNTVIYMLMHQFD